MSSLTREEYLALIDGTAAGHWHPSQLDKLMRHDTVQRDIIEAQAQRIRELETKLKDLQGYY